MVGCIFLAWFRPTCRIYAKAHSNWQLVGAQHHFVLVFHLFWQIYIYIHTHTVVAKSFENDINVHFQSLLPQVIFWKFAYTPECYEE